MLRSIKDLSKFSHLQTYRVMVPKAQLKMSGSNSQTMFFSYLMIFQIIPRCSIEKPSSGASNAAGLRYYLRNSLALSRDFKPEGSFPYQEKTAIKAPEHLYLYSTRRSVWNSEGTMSPKSLYS